MSGQPASAYTMHIQYIVYTLCIQYSVYTMHIQYSVSFVSLFGSTRFNYNSFIDMIVVLIRNYNIRVL